MSLETEFAAQRFPQRQARSVSSACAVEHYRPHHPHTGRWILACFAADAVCGWLLYRSI